MQKGELGLGSPQRLGGADRPTIIRQQMETICRPFGELATLVFKDMPYRPEAAPGMKQKALNEMKMRYEACLYDYLNRNWLANCDVGTFVRNAAIVAAMTPSESFTEFVTTLPRLDLEKTTEPEKQKGVSLLSFLKVARNMNWSDFYVRVTFAFLVDSLICDFLNRLLLITENLSREMALSIFDRVMEVWFPEREPPEFFTKVRLINGKSIAHSIHILSKIIPDRIADVMIQRMPGPKDVVAETSVQLYLEFFQWVVINDQSKLNYETLPEKFKSLESIARKAKPSGPIHGPAMSYFLNLMGYLLNAYEPYRELKFIFDLSEIAKEYTTENGYSGEAYALRALLYTFNNHKKMKLKLDEYIKKYIEKKMTKAIAPFHVESFLYFARGHNYAAQCDLELTEENLKWHNPDSGLLQAIFEQIVKNPNIYVNCQAVLGDLLVQLACTDFPKFISKNLPELLNPQFATNNLHALFHMSHTILSTHSKFRQYANQGSDSGAIERLRGMLKSEVNSLLESLSSGCRPEAVVAYASVPFVTTLHLSIPRNVAHINVDSESKLKLAIHNLIQTSEAKGRPSMNTVRVNKKQRAKWEKVLIDEFRDLVFESVNGSDIEFCQTEKYHVDACLATIGIIPYLSLTKDTVTYLAKLVFHTLPHVASLSLRVLQSVVHLGTKCLDTILMSLCSVVAVNNEYLYVQLQAIHHVLESGLFMHASVAEETRQKLFFTMIIGLCSHSNVIRTQVLELAKLVDHITKGEDPNLHKFLSSCKDKINEKVQTTVVSLGCYKANIDFEELVPIPFDVIAQTNHDLLYMFVLGAMGQVFVQSELGRYSQQVISFLLDALHQESRDFMFYVNMICFIAGLAGEEQSTILKQKEEEFQTQISCLNNKKIMGYLGFYSALCPQVAIDLLDAWPTDRGPFTIHVMSFIMRMYVTTGEIGMNFAQRKAREIIRYFMKVSLFEPKITFHISEDVLADFDCRSAMNNLLLTLHHVFVEQFSIEGQRPGGVYPRKLHVVSDEKAQKNDALTFAFLFNMNCMPDTEELRITKTLSNLVLNSFARVYVVPSELFNIIRENLALIASVSFNTLCQVLDNYYIDILPQYLELAPTQAIYFKAISHQFIKCETAAEYMRIWKECVEKERSQSDREFESKTFESTGTLLALAFYSLSLLDVQKRQDGYRVLFTLAMATLLVRNPTVDVSDFIEMLICLKSVAASQHPDLAENLLIRISTFLQKHLVFCSEQFLSQAFTLAKLGENNPEVVSAVFYSVITPWLKGMVFNGEEPGVVVGVEQKFIVFSTFSFFEQFVECVISVPLNRSHVTMIDQILEQPSADETSTLAFFVLSLFRLQQKSAGNASKCIAILTYCLSKHTKTIISVLSNYVSFKGWYYYQIQLSQIDIAFNMNDDDYNTNRSKGGEQGDRPRRLSIVGRDGDGADSIALYDVMVKFALRVLLDFVKSNKNSVSRISWLVILFSLVHYGQFGGKSDSLLSIMVECDPKMFRSFSSVLMTGYPLTQPLPEAQNEDVTNLWELIKAPMPIVAAAVQHLTSLSLKDRQQLCHEALLWALGCGDILIAVRCAKVYEMFMNESDVETVNVIIRTIHIFASIVSERSDPEYKNPTPGMSPQSNSRPPDYVLAIKYIASLLRILKKAQRHLPAINEDAFWLATQCLKATSRMQMPIVCEALHLIIDCIKNRKFLGTVSNSPDANFKGFLNYIVRMQHTPLSLSLSYELMTTLVLENHSLLFMETCNARDLLMMMLPYIYTHQYDVLISSVLSAISNLIDDMSMKQRLFSSFAGSVNDFICSVMTGLLHGMTSAESLTTIIEFYSHVVRVCPDMIPPILLISTSILLSPLPDVMTEDFGEIGFTAIHDEDITHNTLALNFLSALNKRKGGITPHSPMHVMTMLPVFELHAPIDILGWTPPENGDVFSRIQDLPPLSVIDPEYLGCTYQKPISQIVQVVKVQPLTAWSCSMFRAEALEIQVDVTFDQTAVRPGKDYNSLFSAFMDVATAGYVSANEAKRSPPTHRKGDRRRARPTAAAESAHEAQSLRFAEPASSQIIFFATRDFMPKREEIDAEGADILAAFDVPTFFPMELK